MSFWQQSFGVPADTEENENTNSQQQEVHNNDESDDNLMANDSFWDDDAYGDDDFGDEWENNNKEGDTIFPDGPLAPEEVEEVSQQQNYEAYIAPDDIGSPIISSVMQEDANTLYSPQIALSQEAVAEEEVADSADIAALVEYPDGNQQQTNEFPSPSDGRYGTAHEWPKDTIEGDTAGDYLTQRTGYNHHYDAHHHLMTTPSREDKHSEFIFLSDQKAVPSELKRLQEKTRRRRRDMNNQFHKLELQIAGATSAFAEEKMDLGLAVSDTFERACCKPLEEAAERIVMERETVMDRRPAVLSVEKRLSKLSVDMMRHVHVEMNDAKKNELDSFRREFLQDMIPSMRIEKSMADKIEGGIVRRYETSAGLASKNFHQECAARKAELEMFHRTMKRELQTQEQHSEDILDVIRNLRRQLQMEREERKVADRKLMDDITKTSIAMRRAFLAAFDDSSTT